MKYDGSWWGVWLVPESEPERMLLATVMQKIAGQLASYEAGEPYIEKEVPPEDGHDHPPQGALVLPR